MQTKVTTPDPRLASRVPIHLRQIATDYRLRLSRDECGEVIIKGSKGHLYAHDDSVLAVLVFLSSKRAWTHARKKLITAGLALLQDCDTEGTASLDSQNPEQVNLAIRVAGVKQRRRVTPETAERLGSFSRWRRTIAGRALLAAETNVVAGRYIPSHPNQVGAETSSPAMKPAKMDGAK